MPQRQPACFSFRYALQLIDTVLVGADKGTYLTTGLRSVKDTMFFLNQEEAESSKAPTKKAQTAKGGANGNASPAKNKTAGGKVLRNKTRSAAQEELVQSMAKIGEHQRVLHAKLHMEGLAKFSEGSGGTGGKEGKAWKRFQSYKGEAALPREVESLRVRRSQRCCDLASSSSNYVCPFRFTSTRSPRLLCCPFMVTQSLSTSTQSRMSARTRRQSSRFSV